MKSRIEASLAAIAEAQEALVKASVFLRNIEYLERDAPPPSDDWGGPIVPDPALTDDPPSREP
jgi:hypothetical protein